MLTMSASQEYTSDDFRHGMPPRVFGSEIEYGTDTNIEAIFHYNINKGHYSEDMVRFADPHYLLADVGDSDRFYLTTGGELYFDVGNLEYATPECLSPEELLLHERAGEQLVSEFVGRITKELHKKARVSKRSGFTTVMKNDEILMEENSVGHHENYYSRNVFSTIKYDNDPYHPDARTQALNAVPEVRGFADFLALRKLVDGAGMVDMDHYSISQKPVAIDYRGFKSSLAHGHKQPFQQKGSNRLEVRTSEGNKSDFVVKLKYGLTSLIIRLIEHHAYPTQLLLADPSAAVADLSRDPHAEVALENGLYMRGMDVLKGIVDAAVDLNQKFPDAPKYEQEAAEDFYTFYDDLKNISLQDGDVATLSDRIDWAARFEHLLKQGASYDTISTKNLRMVREDLLWDMLGEPDPAREYYRKFGHTALRVDIPKPPKSRARARSKLARRLFSADRLLSIQWDKVLTKDGDHYNFPDPSDEKPSLTYTNRHYRS